jgi:hypothetical protein
VDSVLDPLLLRKSGSAGNRTRDLLVEHKIQRMPSSVMLRRVALVRTDVSEELSASELVAVNVVPSSPSLVIVMMEAPSSSTSWFLQEPHGVISHKRHSL